MRWAKTKNNQSSDRTSTTHRPAPHTSHQQQPNTSADLTRDSTVFVDKAKFCLINARSLRNKSLFVRNYVDECSLDIVALTETWLTRLPFLNFAETTLRSFISRVEALDAVEASGFCSAKLSCQCRHPRLRNTLRHSTKCPYQLHNACNCDLPITELVFWNISGRRVYGAMIAGTHPTETVVCGDFNTKYAEPTCTDAVNLADQLDTAEFTQHVTGATHERGNTLDLVITAKTSHPIATAVKPTSLITDHYANSSSQNQAV